MGTPPYIPITVFTGFLGAGKTSIILSLLPRLPKEYKVVLLKNEYGDVEVDSQLAKQSSLAAVSEILNGCMCCILVGQMKTALLEIREKYRPDRIIIECSGSAFPATLAFQIRELEKETQNDLRLDAIITVIDAENFEGYEDTSPTARMQASYTDMIIINKWELVDERKLDHLLDHINDLNDTTPKIRAEGRNGVDPSLIFGLDSKLFMEKASYTDASHHDEVETITLYKGPRANFAHSHVDHKEHSCGPSCHHSNMHTEAAHRHPGNEAETHISEEVLTKALAALPKESVWRVKGFVRTENGPRILNWAFSRFDLIPIDAASNALTEDELLKLTVMGERGEVKRLARKHLAEALNAKMH